MKIHPLLPVLPLQASAVPALPDPGAPPPARKITIRECAAAAAALHPIEALRQG